MTDINTVLADQKCSGGLIIEVAGIVEAADVADYNMEDLEVRIELLDGYWLEFVQRDLIIQRHSEALKERSYVKEKQFQLVQNKYLRAKSWLRARIKKLLAAALPTSPSTDNSTDGATRTAPTSHSNTSVLASLEKLRLPRFNGCQREWETFKEKFTSLILSDEGMSPIIKFQHLANCLDGEAAEKLKGIKASGTNLQTAWDTLCRRYDNEYLRFSLQMQLLVQMPSSVKECSSHLNLLLNTINASINTFTALSRPVDK